MIRHDDKYSPSHYSPNEVAVVLTEAIELLKRGWCQTHSAVDEDDKVIHSKSKDAKCWCAVGAISAVTSRDELFARCYSELASEVGGSLGDWNDSSERTQEDVLDLFQAVLEKQIVH